MRLMCIVILLLGSTQLMQAQGNTKNSTTNPLIEYEGGNVKMVEAIKRKIEAFSYDLGEKEVKGEMSFVVTKEGTTKDIVFRNISNDSLTYRIKEAVEGLKTWKPTKGNNALSEAKITIPIVINGHPATVEEMDYVLTVPNVYSESDEVYVAVQVIASYRGGMSRFNREIIRSLIISDEEGSKKQIRFIMHFVVEKDGSLTDIKLAKPSNDRGVNRTAIRAFERAGKWIPGMKKNTVVRSEMTVPVTITQ